MAKDACYKKVKARYKVFPSAYASGAIAKCRKVGAKNWGTGGKKKKSSGSKKAKKYYWPSARQRKARNYGSGSAKIKARAGLIVKPASLVADPEAVTNAAAILPAARQKLSANLQELKLR